MVNDPLLTPVPPAPHVLTNWREALGYITNRSLDVATSFQEIGRAEGLRRQALALALPTITATGAATYQFVKQDYVVNGVLVTPTNPVVTGQLTASLPVLAPRAWYGIKTAEMGVTSAKLSFDDKRARCSRRVASAIVTVFTAERVAEINRVGLRSALERHDLTQRKFRLGDATQLDVCARSRTPRARAPRW